MDWGRAAREPSLEAAGHVLLTVAQCGKHGRAAAQLAVLQPAISKVIAVSAIEPSRLRQLRIFRLRR